jgi:hypothetical protein
MLSPGQSLKRCSIRMPIAFFLTLSRVFHRKVKMTLPTIYEECLYEGLILPKNQYQLHQEPIFAVGNTTDSFGRTSIKRTLCDWRSCLHRCAWCQSFGFHQPFRRINLCYRASHDIIKNPATRNNLRIIPFEYAYGIPHQRQFWRVSGKLFKIPCGNSSDSFGTNQG